MHRRSTIPQICALLATMAADARADPPPIIERLIRYDAQRKDLTLRYIKRHYGLDVRDVTIEPRAIVIHWTGTRSLEGTWRAFNRVQMRSSRRHLVRGGRLNVSAHFLVARDGTIYRLVPETWMARHCIGLNHDAIGIENLGGGKRAPLTRAQLRANAALVRHLVSRFPIRYLVGHMEWRRFQHLPIFRELDPTYRNAKPDPGPRFMRRLRALVADLRLLGPDGAKKGAR
jgi:N-acetyl-anhydromuramyl-L-alanine amidase AmpD